MLVCWWVTSEIIRFEYLELWTANCRFKCWREPRAMITSLSMVYTAELLVPSFITCVHISDNKAGKGLWEIPKPGVRRNSQSHPTGWAALEHLSRLLFSCQMLLKAKRDESEFVTACDADRARAAQCSGVIQDVVPASWNLLPTFWHVFEGELAPCEMSYWPGNAFSRYLSYCGIGHAESGLRTTLWVFTVQCIQQEFRYLNLSVSPPQKATRDLTCSAHQPAFHSLLHLASHRFLLFWSR